MNKFNKFDEFGDKQTSAMLSSQITEKVNTSKNF